MLQTSKIEYADGEVDLEGYCALDDSKPGKKPVVLVVHDWSGRNDFACQKAEELAKLGYIGFAIDMYGIGKLGKTIEEKQTLMTPLIEDRSLLRKRILTAFETARTLSIANTTKIAVIGFCFGGLCALDLARSGAEIKGAVSFHGLLMPPSDLANKKIHAKILALHGYDDPMAPPEQVAAFQKEMTDSDVDWQTYIYGNVQHAFTNPVAHDPKMGTVYDASADKRSWESMRSFLEEIFASS